MVGSYSERRDHAGGEIWTVTEYNIMRCRGCEAVYFKIDSVFSEDVDHDDDTDYTPHTINYWPAPSKRNQPEWSSKLHAFDRDLADLFDDVYAALDNYLGVLAAIGMRTVFDRAAELLDVDPNQSFTSKLNKLNDLGKIGTEEKDTLAVLTDAGSAAAHRGWRPTPGELDTMMSIIEAFLYRAFVLNAAAKKLKQVVPPRRKQQKRPDDAH